MRICVFGAGAIGGNYATRLAAAGNEVSVVARGPHLDAIRANGLTLLTGDKKIVAKVAASDKPADLGPQDVVISTLKASSLVGARRHGGAAAGTGHARRVRAERHSLVVRPRTRRGPAEGARPVAPRSRRRAAEGGRLRPHPGRRHHLVQPRDRARRGPQHLARAQRAVGRRARRPADAAHHQAARDADRRRHRLALDHRHPLRHLAQADGQPHRLDARA